MKVFISYSLNPKDEFILTLLAFFLKEENISVILSQNSSEKFDALSKTKINETSLFIGILLNDGKLVDNVIHEWNYALERKMPNLILIEESIPVENLYGKNFIRFNREDIQSCIYAIERKMKSKEENSPDSQSSLAWIIGGNAICRTLEKGFNSTASSTFVISGRLQLIEQRLTSMDSAGFQNLCDIYLALRQKEFASFNRTGSQLGKQKTVKGTPDTFFRLPDGSLRYVEYTTKSENVVAKIKEDLDKCLDENVTGVETKTVNKIIVCFNSRLTVFEETQIMTYAESKSIQVELIGLDRLALEIYSKYLILAKDILGIPLDTGQLLPLQKFVEEYNNKAGKLSTPLNNIFFNREKELKEIEIALNSNDILIISGFPGVGKTKIALKGVLEFLSKNKNYSAFAISKKDQDISADLKIHLQQNENYILLVDDANRQLVNFKQILAVFKEKIKGNLKLVITVRDYALKDVVNECFEFEPYKLVLNKFSDEEIKEIIDSDSFEIRNPKYQKKIVEIADGNARLAIMAARLAKQKQEIFLLGNVSDLYDSYFHTFIKDFDLFENKVLLKTLGIISFFFTIDRSNKRFIENLLKNFNLDYHDFNESINELEKRELLEVQFNNARISEQVMATYFFYKVFIKDEMLSFDTLLFNYFSEWQKRFSDTIIPANNSFGYSNVFDKINGSLNAYLNYIQEDEDKVLKFFKIFWFYKQEELLDYFYKKVKEIQEPFDPKYCCNYETNDFVWEHDETLYYLSNLFTHFSDNFIPAIELSFEYCRKVPKALPELIKKIRENLLFDEDDYRYDFQRQVELFKLLISKFKETKAHYVEAMFALSSTFLMHYYQITKGGRNHTISIYHYPLPFYEVTRNFRKEIWTTILNSFFEYPEKVLSILKSFKPSYKESIPEILKFDLSFIIPFVEKNLSANHFEHTYFVNDFVAWLDREDIQDRTYQNLLGKFQSKEYEYFKMLDWNRLRGKRDYEFERYEDFERLKEQDIRNSLIFKSIDELPQLYTAISNFISIEKNNTWGLDKSLNIITEENFIKNEELGFELMKGFLSNFPTLNPPYKGISMIVGKSKEWALRFWDLIKQFKDDSIVYWKLSFFDCLPKDFVDNYFKEGLLETVKSINGFSYLAFGSFEKFIPVDKDIISRILSITVDKVENEKSRIILSHHFFEKYSFSLGNNFELLAKAYIQQEKINAHFDFDRKELNALVKMRPDFLIEFLISFYSDKVGSTNKNTHTSLSFVWDLENYEALLESAFNIMIDNHTFLGILEHPIVIFFNGLNEESMEKSKIFLTSYISKYNKAHKKINVVFDVIRRRMKEFFETALLHYLSLNSNITDFKQIYWRGNGGTYSGDVIIGEIEAADWQNILSIIGRSSNQLDLIPIKRYITKQIEGAFMYAEQEKKRRFTTPDYY